MVSWKEGDIQLEISVLVTMLAIPLLSYFFFFFGKNKTSSISFPRSMSQK